MGFVQSEKVRTIVPAAMLLLVVLLFMGACSDDEKNRKDDPPGQKTEGGRGVVHPLPPPCSKRRGNSRPPEVTLGDDAGGEPKVVIRLEGDPTTTFSGLCSVGAEQKVLSGQVPKRFEFDLKGRQLSCRIEKRDNKKGDLKVVLIAGEATRSVQQTNTSGGVIEVSYER